MLDVKLINRDKIFTKGVIIICWIIIILQIINAITLKSNEIKLILWGMFIMNLIYFAIWQIFTIINFKRFKRAWNGDK